MCPTPARKAWSMTTRRTSRDESALCARMVMYEDWSSDSIRRSPPLRRPLRRCGWSPTLQSTSMDKSTGHRPDIDGLRAIAILPVVLYHARIPGFSGGFVGVDIFFVISGYLITYLIIRDLDGGRFTFSNFWLRRARRILPAATIVMLPGLAIGWFYLLPNDYRRAGQSAFAESLFASNIYFWSKTCYFFDPAETMPFLHTWSLAVEEQFYWLFPFFLVGLPPPP